RGNAGDPVGDPEYDPFADRDEGHAGNGRTDRRRDNARDPLPAGRKDTLAEKVDLPGEGCAVAVDEEQRDQHEEQGEKEMKYAVARRDHGAIDIADIRAADDLYQLADGARRADMALPLLTEPASHARQVGD